LTSNAAAETDASSMAIMNDTVVEENSMKMTDYHQEEK